MDFDIVKFNKEINNGDLGALDYIKESILDNMQEDLSKLNRVDYLKSLYSSVIALNTCVVVTEQCGNVTENCRDIYDKYAEIRDLLFNELGIKYSYDYNEYYIGEEN